jgi:hypothetical protein
MLLGKIIKTQIDNLYLNLRNITMIKTITISILIILTGLSANSQIDTCGSLNRPIPVKPSNTTVSTYFCEHENSSFNLGAYNTLSGASVFWFDSSATNTTDTIFSIKKGNQILLTGLDTLAPGTYIYYVSQAVKGCQSIKVPITFDIYPKLHQPIITSDSACLATFTAKGVTNATFQWIYNTREFGSTFKPNVYSSNSTPSISQFTIVQSAPKSCPSDIETVKFKTYPKPIKPIFASTTQSICKTSKNIPPFIVTNATSVIQWTDGVKTSTGTTFTPEIPAILSPKVLSLKISAVQMEYGCTSDTAFANLAFTPRVPQNYYFKDITTGLNAKPVFNGYGDSSNILKWYNKIEDVGTSNFQLGNSFEPKNYDTSSVMCGTATTLYYVTQTTTDSSHCESPSLELKLTIKTRPKAPTIKVPTFLYCANQITSNPLIVENTNNSPYQWFVYDTKLEVTSNDGIVSGINNSVFTPYSNILTYANKRVYYVRYKSSNYACESDSIVGRYKIARDINNIPIFLTDNNPICPTPNSKLIEIFAQGNILKWTVNDTLQSSDSSKFLFIPQRFGTYKITISQAIEIKDPNISNTLTCPGPSHTIIQEVTDDCTASKNIISKINLNISPNPASKILHLNANSEVTSSGKLKLFNINGILVYEKYLASVNNIDEIISIASLSNGIYTLVIETDSGAQSKLISVIK